MRWVPAALLTGIKRPGLETNHSFIVLRLRISAAYEFMTWTGRFNCNLHLLSCFLRIHFHWSNLITHPPIHPAMLIPLLRLTSLVWKRHSLYFLHNERNLMWKAIRVLPHFVHYALPYPEHMGWTKTFRTNKTLRFKKKKIPVPGIEPEPPGWKPGILATRPYRTLTPTLLRLTDSYRPLATLSSCSVWNKELQHFGRPPRCNCETRCAVCCYTLLPMFTENVRIQAVKEECS